jgi:hypothetical protein
MRDHFSENYEWGEDGKLRRRKRIARDGERITFATISDHAAFGFRETFADNSPDITDPHRPGFRFLDTNDTTRIAADHAYERMRSRLDYRHRQQDSGARTPTLDELEQAAVDAYRARSERLRTAWKTHHA